MSELYKLKFPLWPAYDPAAPLRNPDPRYIGSGYDSLGRWWHGVLIAPERSTQDE